MYWQGAWTAAVTKNTRLAVYGDVVLNMALCRLWCPKNLSKGTITSFLSTLCSPVLDCCLGNWTTARNLGQNSNLADVGFQHGLDACVILNPETPDASRLSMASTIEAIIGAVELDGGSEPVMPLVTSLGLVHPMLTSVMSRSPFLPLDETIYTINVMASSALPLAALPSSTHGSFNQVQVWNLLALTNHMSHGHIATRSHMPVLQ
jgi:hypothetical protein